MAEAGASGTTASTSGAPEVAVGAAAVPTHAAAPQYQVEGGGGGGGGGSRVWTQEVPYRYFMQGMYREGNNGHSSQGLSTAPSATGCRYDQQECCAYEQPQNPEEETAANLAAEHTPPTSSSPPTWVEPRAEAESENSHSAAAGAGTDDWVNAMEFVPGQPYWGRTAPSCTEAPLQGMLMEEESETPQTSVEMNKQLCIYAAVGECRYGENCVYLHGEVCDLCSLQVLHPVDATQRSQHLKSCIEAHEKDMELSFAVQRSKDMVCGICMERVYEKANPSERRFGILSTCNHIFCLNCIRKWRSTKDFENKIIKSCPQCRLTSNFVIPSEFWVEEKEEKQKLIQKYKEAMSTKPCRYFNEGRGRCPFRRNCFYQHVYPDGHRQERWRQRVGPSNQLVGSTNLTDSEDQWYLFHNELFD